jgi:hypothetical protein
MALTRSSVWRPLRHAVGDWPLAVCDGGTVKYSDLLETDVVREDFEEHVGSNMFALFREGYRWYYASRQRTSEVWVFKQFDSDEGVRARCTCVLFFCRLLLYWCERLIITWDSLSACVFQA